MENKDLLKFCRYYKGEKENPYDNEGQGEEQGETQNKALLWQYERAWIEANFSEDGKNMLMGYISEYASVGLAMFELHDDIPVSYKALLFNRYARTAYSIIYAAESFKKFYHKYYK